MLFLLFLIACVSSCERDANCQPQQICVSGRCGVPVGRFQPCDHPGIVCRPEFFCSSAQRCLPIETGGKGGPGDFDNCTSTEDCGLNEVCINGLCNLVTSSRISTALIVMLGFLLLLSLAIVATLIFVCLRKQSRTQRIGII